MKTLNFTRRKFEQVLQLCENDTPIVVSVEEVLSHLQRIGSGKSSGLDNLPNWVLKSYADLLAEPVTAILNAGVFPGGTAIRGVEASKRILCHSQK